MCIRDSPRTAPIAAMEIELGIEPIDLFIKKQIWNKHLRNLTLPSSHPLRSMLATNITQSFSKRVDTISMDMPEETP